MSVYIQYITRSSPVGLLVPCYCLIPRRYYADRKSSNTHYEALGVNSNASAKEIKAAFYKLSKKHHPDKNPDDDNAAKKFSTISNAYDVLGDPVKRRDYDSELLSQTSASDPYVTYDRTSTYAQRARAHRPSSWKPPPSGGGGFQGSENAFGNSRYGTFNKEQYDAAFGRYRGPTPQGRSTVYDYDEFYRAHYNDFKSWSTSRKEAQERARRERVDEESKRQANANRSAISRVSTLVVWLSLGVIIIIGSNLLHDMSFRTSSNGHSTDFYIINKSKPKPASEQGLSTKS